MNLTQTWDKIYKPEKYQGSRPEQFFEIEYIAMPPKPVNEEEFAKACSDLRARFSVDH